MFQTLNRELGSHGASLFNQLSNAGKALLLVVGFMFVSGCEKDQGTQALRDKNAIFDRSQVPHLELAADRVLTLQDMIQIAVSHNLDIAVANQEARFQQEAATGSRLKMLPSLIISSDRSRRTIEDASKSLTKFGRVKSAEPIFSSEKNRFAANVNVAWSLLDFGLSYFRSRQARQAVKVAQERARRVRQNLAFEVADAYWDAQVSSQAMQRARELQKVTEARLPIIEKEMADGNMSTQVGLEKQADIIESRVRLRRYESEFNSNKARLSSLMGLAVGLDFVMTKENLSVLPKILTLDIDALEKEAIRSRPELIEQDLQEKVAADDARIAIASMFPNANIFARRDRDANRFLYKHNWYTIGMSASLDLLSLPNKLSKRQQAKLRGGLVRKRRLALTIGVIAQIRLAAISYDEAVREYKVLHELFLKREAIFEEVKREFTEGNIDEEQKIDSEARAFFARIRLYTSYATLMKAKARLWDTVGREPGTQDNGELPKQDLTLGANRDSAAKAEARAKAESTDGGVRYGNFRKKAPGQPRENSRLKSSAFSAPELERVAGGKKPAPTKSQSNDDLWSAHIAIAEKTPAPKTVPLAATQEVQAPRLRTAPRSVIKPTKPKLGTAERLLQLPSDLAAKLHSPKRSLRSGRDELPPVVSSSLDNNKRSARVIFLSSRKLTAASSLGGSKLTRAKISTPRTSLSDVAPELKLASERRDSPLVATSATESVVSPRASPAPERDVLPPRSTLRIPQRSMRSPVSKRPNLIAALRSDDSPTQAHRIRIKKERDDFSTKTPLARELTIQQRTEVDDIADLPDRIREVSTTGSEKIPLVAVVPLTPAISTEQKNSAAAPKLPPAISLNDFIGTTPPAPVEVVELTEPVAPKSAVIITEGAVVPAQKNPLQGTNKRLTTSRPPRETLPTRELYVRPQSEVDRVAFTTESERVYPVATVNEKSITRPRDSLRLPKQILEVPLRLRKSTAEEAPPVAALTAAAPTAPLPSPVLPAQPAVSREVNKPWSVSAHFADTPPRRFISLKDEPRTDVKYVTLESASPTRLFTVLPDKPNYSQYLRFAKKRTPLMSAATLANSRPLIAKTDSAPLLTPALRVVPTVTVREWRKRLVVTGASTSDKLHKIMVATRQGRVKPAKLLAAVPVYLGMPYSTQPVPTSSSAKIADSQNLLLARKTIVPVQPKTLPPTYEPTPPSDEDDYLPTKPLALPEVVSAADFAKPVKKSPPRLTENFAEVESREKVVTAAPPKDVALQDENKPAAKDKPSTEDDLVDELIKTKERIAAASKKEDEAVTLDLFIEKDTPAKPEELAPAAKEKKKLHKPEETTGVVALRAGEDAAESNADLTTEQESEAAPLYPPVPETEVANTETNTSPNADANSPTPVADSAATTATANATTEPVLESVVTISPAPKKEKEAEPLEGITMKVFLESAATTPEKKPSPLPERHSGLPTTSNLPARTAPELDRTGKPRKRSLPAASPRTVPTDELWERISDFPDLPDLPDNTSVIHISPVKKEKKTLPRALTAEDFASPALPKKEALPEDRKQISKVDSDQKPLSKVPENPQGVGTELAAKTGR